MKKLLLFLTIISLYSCNSSEKKKETSISEEKEMPAYEALAQLDWILGNWENINTDTASYEQWVKNNDSVYVGASMTLRGQDTIFAERMKLYYEKDSLKLYVETIGDEPNPVVFTQQIGAENTFTFSNWKNKFPSQIIYTQPEKDKIHAWVIGEMEGPEDRMDFYFTRSKE